ncbi:MAG: hypothetical protein SFX73_20590 [Kofleriaceae bacterium]|nr:hypothetical protein [Kofleriaceae bacterium]
MVMPRGPGASDFVPYRSEEERATAPVEEPDKVASKGATKAVYIVMFIVLLALFLITAIGPHIPAGE